MFFCKWGITWLPYIEHYIEPQNQLVDASGRADRVVGVDHKAGQKEAYHGFTTDISRHTCDHILTRIRMHSQSHIHSHIHTHTHLTLFIVNSLFLKGWCECNSVLFHRESIDWYKVLSDWPVWGIIGIQQEWNGHVFEFKVTPQSSGSGMTPLMYCVEPAFSVPSTAYVTLICVIASEGGRRSLKVLYKPFLVPMPEM